MDKNNGKNTTVLDKTGSFLELFGKLEELKKQRRVITGRINDLESSRDTQMGRDFQNEYLDDPELLKQAIELKHMTVEQVFFDENYGSQLFKILKRKYAPKRYMSSLHHPLKLMEIERNRPAGFPFPESWGLDGIYIPTGQPMVIGAYTGVGKSTTLLNLAYEAIEKERLSIFFSCEMTPGQLWVRLCGIHLCKKYTNIDEGYIWSKNYREILDLIGNGDQDITEFAEMAKDYLIVTDATGFTVGDITESYDYLTEKRGKEPDQVFIDYLQIVLPEEYSSRTDRRIQVMDTMSKLTNKAKVSTSAWIIAAQTNRESHKKDQSQSASDHSSFQESAAIEQNTSVAIMLGKKQDKDKQWTDEMDIRVSKNRFGKIKSSKVKIDPKTGTILAPIV